MEKLISGKKNQTSQKRKCTVPNRRKYVPQVLRTVSMGLLAVASAFFITAVFSPVYIRGKLGIFRGLSADDFLMLMSVCACVAVGLLVWEGIYIVRRIVKKSLSRYKEGL